MSQVTAVKLSLRKHSHIFSKSNDLTAVRKRGKPLRLPVSIVHRPCAFHKFDRNIFRGMMDEMLFSCVNSSVFLFAPQKCGLLAYTTAVFLKNCCTKNFLFRHSADETNTSVYHTLTNKRWMKNK